jgi:hypothetical protein
MTVTVDVHKLWSGTRASPNAGHFGHLAFRLEPDAPCELALAQILEKLNLPLIELSDEKVLLAVAVYVGPTGSRVAGAFDADSDPVRLQTNRAFKFGSAAQGRATQEPECCEQSLLHESIPR